MQIIDVDMSKVYYIDVSPNSVDLAKAINGRHLQESRKKKDLNRFFELIGGEGGFDVDPEFGTVIRPPTPTEQWAIESFFIFWYR